MSADPADLTEHLLRLAAEAPRMPAITAPGRATMTFHALAQQIERLRATLSGLGIARGDVVAWRTGDRAQTAVAMAAMPVSSTIAPLATQATEDVARDLIARVKPKAVVVPPDGDAALERLAGEHGADVLVAAAAGDGVGAFDLRMKRPARSPERTRWRDPRQVILGATSGTTGRPKLVPHGHRQILCTARAIGARTGLGPGDVSGHIMPLHLSGGMRSPFYHPLCLGAAVRCLPETDVEALVDAIAAGEVTYTSVSFTMAREMLRRLAGRRDVAAGRMRYVRIGSGRVEPDEMDRLERALGAPVVSGLSLSEIAAATHQDPRLPRKRGVVGPPLDGEIRLTDADGRVVAPGEIGEVQVRGPQLFDGYVDDDALNAATHVDGWFRTGDLGRLDADGDIAIVGRAKEVINRGGDKIAPLEIDAVLESLPGVAEAATFGVPHPRLGEEVVVAVVLAPGATADPDALLASVRTRLGVRRAPRRVYFVASLPRGDAGKVLRRELPAWVGHVAAAPGDDAAGAPASSESPLERVLSALWSSALARADIGRDQAFYAQGGDDVRAERLCAEVAAVFGVAMPATALRDDASTIVSMARYIERARSS